MLPKTTLINKEFKTLSNLSLAPSLVILYFGDFELLSFAVSHQVIMHVNRGCCWGGGGNLIPECYVTKRAVSARV